MNKTNAAIVRTLLLGTSCLSVLGVAQADPTGGTVVGGQGTITQHGGNSTVIDQKTGKLVINWDSFSIGAGGTVQFNQPGQNSIALNRVTGSQPTSIYGNLLANGQVWIINGNGVLFGKGSQTNVGGLIATTADIRDGDFLGGNYSFSGGTGASVVNQGTIRTRKGGSVLLSGASVSNQGLISADTGTVVLGGSSAYTVDFDGDGLLRYAITAPTGKADNGQTGVSNSGTIKAAGGRVVMTARAASSVQDAVVNNTGMISATSAKVQNGEVILDGGDGDVSVSGTVDASGAAAGATGGTVTVTGRNVTVADNTKIDVSGDAGGGTVKIGGDLHGGGTLQQADNVHVGSATIKADATHRGNGGTLVVWSTGQTDFAGIVSAKGGAAGGNGGFIETSGHNLSVAPTTKVDTSAPHGKTGNWLLDPSSIVIDNSGSTQVDGTLPVDQDSGSTDFISPTTLIAALTNSNVTLEASTAIEVNDAVIYTSDHSLTLLSEGEIGINEAVQNGGAGNITLIAGWDGSSTDFSNLLVNGSDTRFGNNSGNVAIGNGHAAVGSLGGTTLVAGYNVLLQAQSNDAVAQIGYRIGVGAGGTSDIIVAAQNQVSLFAGEGTNALAMIGNGDKFGLVTGPVSGDITIMAGNVLRTQVYTGGTLWIGNASPGGESGNVTLVTGAVDDASCCGFEGQGSILPMLTADLNGGNVTWESTAADIDIDQPMLYASPYDLTLMSVGNVNIGASIQNAQPEGAGAINLVAGWDGVTAMADIPATSGAYGNNDGGIAIGAGEGGPDVAVGTAGGTTNVFTGTLDITSSGGYAQLGYHGVGGGDINVTTSGDLYIESFGGFDAMLGNGSFQEGDEGGVTGNIDVRVGGLFGIYDDNNGDLGEHVWFGNVSASFAETGNVTIIAADGDVPSSFADMVAADLNGGDFTVGFTGEDGGSIGDIIYDSPHDFTALSTTDLYIAGSVQNGGSGAINLVAGWDGVSTNVNDIRDNYGYGVEGYGTVTIDGYYGGAYVGSKGGATNVLTGNLVVETGFDEGTNAQLGYHGNGTGNITVLATGDVSLLGGDASVGSPYAMIGNGALDGSVTGDVGGDIFVSAQGTLRSETLDGAPPCDDCGFAEGAVAGRGLLSESDGGLPFVTGIGNATTDGTITGSTVLLAGSLDDQFDTNGGFGRMIASDLSYGDVTLGHTSCECSLEVAGDIIYDSSHTLNLVSASDLDIEGKIQNSGSGTINLVAGWDGDLSNIGVDGHYGLDGFGTVDIGGSNAAGDSWVGGAIGATNVYAASLSLDATNGYAQLGYHGAGGGDINVKVTQNINGFGSSGNSNTLQLGNGSLAGDIQGDVTGNISLDAGNQTVFFSQQGIAWLGNAASDGYKETGNVTSLATTGSYDGDFMEADLGTSADTGGDLFIGFRNNADAVGFRIGGLEYDSPHSLVFATGGSLDVVGSVINDGAGDITIVAGWDGTTVGTGAEILAAHAYGLNGAVMNVGGDHAYSIDDFDFSNDQTANLSIGTAGGHTNILTGDLDIAPAEGFYAQIGYHGLTGGDILVRATGEMTLTGGATAAEYAMIGNGSLTGDVEGQATGNIDIAVGGESSLLAGAAGGNVWIGNASGLTPSGNIVWTTGTLDAETAIGAMIGTDLAGGDVTIGVTDDLATPTLSDAIQYDSSHTLSMLSAGNIVIAADVQNAGTGAINLIAGWDGTTLDPAHILNDGVYANNGGGVTIGGADATGNVSVGSANGATHVAGAFVTVDGEGHTAQLGYGGGDGTGILTIYTPGELNLDAGAAANSRAVLGTPTGGLVVFADAISQQANTAITTTDANLNAASGNIVLSSSQNDITGTLRAVADGGSVTVASQSGMVLDLIEAGSGATITSGGNITQMADRNIDVTGALSVSSTGGDITLDDRNNSFGDLTVSTAGSHSATIVGGQAINVASASVGGTLSLDATDGDITQSGAISAGGLDVTAELGDITLTNGDNSFHSLTASTVDGYSASFVSSGDLAVDGATIGGLLTLNIGEGSITQGAAITANGLDVTVTGGAVTLDNAGNAVTGTASFSAPDGVTFTNSIATELGASDTGGSFTLRSGGAVTQSGALDVAGLDVRTTAGTITLTDADNTIGQLAISTGGTDNASVASAGDLRVASATVGGTLTLAVGEGAITQTGAIIAQGLDVSTTGGAITLTNSGNDFAALTVGTANADNASISDGTDLSITSAHVGGTLTLNLGEGSLSQTGAIVAGGLDASATEGGITLTDTDNSFASLSVHAGTDATVVDSTGVALGGSATGGGLSLTAGGAVTQTGTISAATLGIDNSAGTGGITLSDTGNHVTGAVTLKSTGAVSFADNTATVLGQVDAGGTFTLHSGGAVTQTGTIHADALDITAVTGAVTLTNVNNDFASLEIDVQDGHSDAAVAVLGNLDVVGAGVGGTLTLTSGEGNITQSGAISASDLVLNATGGSVTLTNAGNIFSTLRANAVTADIVDGVGVDIGASSIVRTFTLAAGGPVTQSGAIQAAGLDVSTTSGGITLTDAGNTFSALKVATAGSDDATVQTSGALAVVSADVGGTLTLTAAGDITQASDQVPGIHAAALNVTSTGGAINLLSFDNVFGELTVSTTGAKDALFWDDSVPLSVSSATVGGLLTLDVGVDGITQTGAIHAGGLSVSAIGTGIFLNNTDNQFNTLTVNSSGINTPVSITDKLGFTLSGANTTGSLSLTALTGGITAQSGVSSLGLTLNAAGDLVFAHGNTVGQLIATTGGALTFYDTKSLTAYLQVSGALALLAEGDVSVGASNVQASSGNVAILAGWDGTTTDAAHFGDAGVYGNRYYNSQTGYLSDGTLSFGPGVAIGAQNGTTAAYGSAISLTGNAVGNSQLGYRGTGTGNIIVRATGAITLTGGEGHWAQIGGGTAFGDNATGGDVTLVGTSISSSGTAAVTGDDLSLTATGGGIGMAGGPLQIAANGLTLSVQGGDANLSSPNDAVVFHGADLHGGALIFTAGGAIGQDGAIHAATLNLASQADITLNDAGNSFATLLVNTTGAAAITDSTGVAIGRSSIGGTLTLHAGGAVTQGVPAGNAPQQAGSFPALSAGGLDISTTAGGITLTDPSNHITGTAAFSAPGDVAYTNDGAIDLGQVETDGKVTVRAGGDITQSGYLHAATLDAGTTAGDITLLNKGNAVANSSAQGALFFSAPGDVAYYQNGDIVLGTTNVTGALSLSTLGEIGQVGALNSGALTLIAGDGIALNNSSNLFGPVSITVNGGSNASLVNSGAIVVTGATLAGGEGVAGELDLTAHGTITQTGAIQAGQLELSTSGAGSTITLIDPDNSFDGLGVVTSGAGSNVSVLSNEAVFVTGAQVAGSLSLTAGGDVTESGPLQVNGLTVRANDGAILLTSTTGNAVTGPVNLTADDGVSFYNTQRTVLGSLHAGGDVVLLSKGDVVFLGPAQTTAGNFLVVAGWDGTTTAPTVLGATGTYGNANGSIVIGGVNPGQGIGATGNVAVGASTGSTTAYGYDLTLNGSTAGYAQLGHHGAGGGNITVRALHDLTLNGVSTTGWAMIGNGSLTNDVEGTVTGDIDIRTGGTSHFNAVSGMQAWIGNRSTGAETGNLVFVVMDDDGSQDCDLGCFAQAAIVGGDVTLGITGTDDHDIDGDITYSSSHALTLLLAGGFAVTGTLQNAGTGAITLVAGWDGHSFGSFATAGASGNGGGGVTIGGATAAGDAAVGSAGGTTAIYGASLTLSGQNGYAQLGFHGAGTGAIVVDVTGAVTLTGGGGAAYFAQIGNGGLQTSGDYGGDIAITAGGDLTLSGGAGSEAYAQVGHGGAESNSNTGGYSNVADITVDAADVVLAAGTGSADYAQIGNGGYKSGAGLSGGTGLNGGDITITAGHTVSLTGSGDDGYAQIGNGGSQSNLNAAASAGGTDSGDIIVHAPNGSEGSVTLTSGTGANAYTQIGNGGYAINSGAQAVAANFTVTGDVTVTDLALQGGGPNGYSQIGNGDLSLTGFGNISGDIVIDANGQITYQDGPGPHSTASIGNFTGQGTVSGTLSGATPPNEGGGGGDVHTDPVVIGVIVTNTAGNNPPGNPPITTIYTIVTTPTDEDNGGATAVTASLEAVKPGPLASLDDNGVDGATPYSADSATVVIADSLDGAKKPGSTLILLPGMLKQTGPGQGGLHGVPPADQDFSSWGNEALWQ
ncbi:MAG: filamentous hemagglutinin N-terminal domain-containing protein [Rhizomicrobium sp.]